MCGIAGVFGEPGNAPAEADRVRRMLAAMSHRGPDGVGVESSGWVTFGNCRLAILDPAHSRQPMVHPETGCLLTFNGFIANYRELRSEMEARGERFRTDGDTEVLLRALVLRGEDAVGRLDGMFAFAFHDPRGPRTIIGRDRCGVKPLYHAMDGDRFLFASEIKGLLAGLSRRPAVNPEALLEYLSFQVPLSPRTMFAGIRRLEPGTTRGWTADGHWRHKRMWTVPPAEDRALEPNVVARIADSLRERIRESVGRCLRSDRPVGAYLSGGLDSTLVASLAARAAPLPLFHGAYDEGPQFDERPHARAAAAALGAPLREVVIGPEEAFDALPAIFRAMDEPMGGPGVIGSWFTARAAASEVKVVLGGQGADEIFSGYARHLVVVFGEALRLAVEGEAASLLALLPNLGALRGYEPMLAESFSGEELFPPAEERFFRLVHRGRGMEGLLAADLAAELLRYDARRKFRRSFPGPKSGDLRARMTVFEAGTLLPALLHVEDRTSMAHGIEARVPFLGEGVLGQAFGTPSSILRSAAGLKPLLREVAAPVVPRHTLDRGDKMGFPVPLAKWARGPLRARLRELLMDGECRRRGILRPEAVEPLLDGETVAARRLWAILSLEHWHREFA